MSYMSNDDCGPCDPWIPQQRENDRQYWLQIHQSFIDDSLKRRDEIKVVFIGASIVQNWLVEGRHVWHQYYNGKGCVNYGIGGDMTQNVLWRITNGLFDGLQPKIVVIQCGANNIEPFGPPSEEDISRGMDEIVRELRTRLPDSKLIVVGIMPINYPLIQSKAKRINELIARNVDDLNVFFLDLTSDMTDSSGDQKPQLFTDGLHLSQKGYNVWHNSMQPLFERLLL